MTTTTTYNLTIILRSDGSPQFTGTFTVRYGYASSTGLITSFFNQSSPRTNILASDSHFTPDYLFIDNDFSANGANILGNVPFLQKVANNVPITEWQLWWVMADGGGDGISYTTDNWHTHVNLPGLYRFVITPVGTTNSVVPTYSKPVLVNTNQNNGTNFAARPIKHYRKMLIPVTGSGNGRAGVGMPMDTPGGSSYLGNFPDNTNCALWFQTTTKTATLMKEAIRKSPSTNFSYNKDDSFYDPLTNKTVCVACTPQTNVIKPATTILSKKYYTDSRAYLRSRCLTYDQKLSANPITGIQYTNAQGQKLYPTNAADGPQVYRTQNCNL